jgi:hypothetical protein
MESSDESKKSFFKHIFNFDDDSKSELLNTLQYILIAIIPIVILNKTIGKYIPEADSNKGSIEIVAEILIQIIVTFFGFLLINRFITFFPTFSKTNYPNYHVIYNILSVLMITLSLQTKLGEKVSILVDRISELWNGKKGDSQNNKNNANNKQSGNVKVTQPIAGQQQTGTITGQPAYTEGTAISALPTYNQPSSTQPLPNYNNMYRQDTTPLVGAASPGGTESFMDEVMPANSVLGGGSFGSW